MTIRLLVHSDTDFIEFRDVDNCHLKSTLMKAYIFRPNIREIKRWNESVPLEGEHHHYPV